MSGRCLLGPHGREQAAHIVDRDLCHGPLLTIDGSQRHADVIHLLSDVAGCHGAGAAHAGPRCDRSLILLKKGVAGPCPSGRLLTCSSLASCRRIATDLQLALDPVGFGSRVIRPVRGGVSDGDGLVGPAPAGVRIGSARAIAVDPGHARGVHDEGEAAALGVTDDDPMSRFAPPPGALDRGSCDT